MRDRARTAAAVAAVAFVALSTGGCKVDVSVGVETDAAGTGEVRVAAVFDREAARTIGDFDRRLRTADLRATGWTVAAADQRPDGSVEVVATRAFDHPREVTSIVAAVAGDGGALDRFDVRQDRGLFRTETTFRGNVDLARGIESFSDAELTEALRGLPLGVSVAELERRLGAPVDRVFALQVAARLPGSIESNAPTETGGSAVWSPRLGDQLRLEASASQWNVRNILLLAAATATGTAAIVTGARVPAGRTRRRVRRESR